MPSEDCIFVDRAFASAAKDNVRTDLGLSLDGASGVMSANGAASSMFRMWISSKSAWRCRASEAEISA